MARNCLNTKKGTWLNKQSQNQIFAIFFKFDAGQYSHFCKYKILKKIIVLEVSRKCKIRLTIINPIVWTGEV